MVSLLLQSKRLQADLPCPAELAHVGIVVEDIAIARRRLPWCGKTRWRDAGETHQHVVLNGCKRDISMRIAHSIDLSPSVELIEAVPATPWAEPSDPHMHHACFWAEDTTELCDRLETTHGVRVMGPRGSPSGYFRLAAGGLVEIMTARGFAALQKWAVSPFIHQSESAPAFS